MDTPLVKLARHCYTPQSVRIAMALKEAGAHVNKCNKFGITPIARACMARPPKGPPEKQRIKFLLWLIENKAEMSAVDKGGFTPMYHAAANADIAVCRFLIEHGADVRPNLTCKNPCDIARENNNKKLLVLLSKKALEEEIARKQKKLDRDKAQVVWPS